MCCMMGHQMDHEAAAEKASHHGDRSETLLEVLQRRYALGEISLDQFQEMKRVLGLGAGSAAGAPVGVGAWESAHHG